MLAKLEKVSIQAISVLINYRGTEIVITCFYIPPNCTNEVTFSTLGSYLDEIVLKPNTKHILCGDLNINFFHKGKKNDQLKSTLSAIGLSFVSSQDATKETNYAKMLLDVFFTKFKSSQKVLKTAVSDHFTIKLQFSENNKFSKKKM